MLALTDKSTIKKMVHNVASIALTYSDLDLVDMVQARFPYAF